ncbi:trypsin-like peptidase domain-containing protein [Candidatus Kaiserbacteria bacterium]|nr:trypsin-like peptidase domain-containing protein [Candidatus Kaiserbacteria bacterium]
MSRFATYLGAAAVLFVGIFVVAISERITISQSPVISETAPIITVFPAIESKEIEATTSVQTQPVTVTKKKPAPSAPAPIVLSPIEEIATSIKAALTPSESSSLDASASTLRAALVNIICYAPAGSSLRSISGSGVIVDSKGIILTNAHIAQNFLLADRNVSCTIRAGSPATDKYKVSLIYIPSSWVSANAKIITEANPSGTGEYDFAFLAISKSVTRDELPSYFPSIPLATSPSNIGTPVVIASYGAQFLESSQIQSSLFPTVVFGSVKDVFTFATNTIDVLALGGSAAAQEGSSGGGISNSEGELVGTITTSTTHGTTDTRKLDAITSSYIRAEYANETGSALDLLLNQPIAQSASDFAPRMSALESILTEQLQ